MSRVGRDNNNVRSLRQRTKTARKDENNTVRESLLAALAANEKLVVLTSALATHALPDSTNRLAALTREVASSYPARFFGLGELLEDLVPTAHELLERGLRPLVLMGSTDLARSYAGLSALCAAHAPVIFLLATGTEEGQTWQAQGANDLAILRTLPPLWIGVPGSPASFKQQLALALQNEAGPVALHYTSPVKPTLVHLRVSDNLGIGKAQMLREGKDLVILSLGQAVETALTVAADLAKMGREAAVVDAAWLRPLDEALLGAVANYFSRLVTLEAGSLNAGFGAALLELFEAKGLHSLHLKRISLDDYPSPERLTDEVAHFLDKTLQTQGLAGSSLVHLRPSGA